MVGELREPISGRFPPYTAFHPAVPVWCITPGEGGIIHRFFDTSPVSPSGRYVALTRLPYEDRPPAPGDEAEVVMVDLIEGDERALARTRGWDTQLGAQVQWGASDRELLFNDVDARTWRPFGVRLDPQTGRSQRLDGTIYMVSPDGTASVSPCLRRIGRAQLGYGMILPPERVPTNRGAPDDDGIYLTDLRSGQCRLLVSIAEVLATAQPPVDVDEYAGGGVYGFHVKYSPDGARLMFVLRWLGRGAAGRAIEKTNLLTLRADGTDVRLALPASAWARGGHHPNWMPDGESILMNLRMEDGAIRFVRIGCDGGGVEPLSETIVGSGHPTIAPDGRHILTDVYSFGELAYGDGTTPLRWIDPAAGFERAIVRIGTTPAYMGEQRRYRVDPHPAWDRSGRLVVFNACPDGTRRVYLADMSGLMRT